MIVKLETYAPGTGGVVSLRCPSCRQQGTFESLLNVADVNSATFVLGQRRCPNPACRAHIFFVREGAAIKAAYPPERLDFDSTGIPGPVVKAFEEAISCHATQSYTAAALMVRKTLEELCQERDAKGSNLKERLKSLSGRIMVPQDLIDGMDHLRLLGNDAAHVESQNYSQVGKDEVDIAIQFTREVLKAVYQYATLVRRMKSLQKPEVA